MLVSQQGFTALMVASRAGHVEVVKALLACHADVHAVDNVSGRCVQWYYDVSAGKALW